MSCYLINHVRTNTYFSINNGNPKPSVLAFKRKVDAIQMIHTLKTFENELEIYIPKRVNISLVTSTFKMAGLEYCLLNKRGNVLNHNYCSNIFNTYDEEGYLQCVFDGSPSTL